MATNVHVKSMPRVHVDELPPVDVSVLELPSVDVNVNALPDLRITTIGAVGPVTLAGIPSNYSVGITNLPDVNVRIREIPSLRVHIPANFRLGFSILGVELAALNLCGEAQVITEPYAPNPCERCGPGRAQTQRPDQSAAVGAVLRLGNR